MLQPNKPKGITKLHFSLNITVDKQSWDKLSQHICGDNLLHYYRINGGINNPTTSQYPPKQTQDKMNLHSTA